MALAALAHRADRPRPRHKTAIGGLAGGLALFYGDGMLTPAISVLSAVEGIGVESDSLKALILHHPGHPGGAVSDSAASARIGSESCSARSWWCGSRHGDAGRHRDRAQSAILKSINPWYGIALFIDEPWTAFVALGSVVLAVTGCEALYADMGHFGRRPISRPGFTSRCPDWCSTISDRARWFCPIRVPRESVLRAGAAWAALSGRHARHDGHDHRVARR